MTDVSELSPLLINAANPTYTYVCAFVDELQRMGVQHIVICPGSRSTPLALACAAQPRLRVWMHVDERSAAFFALGLAKRAVQPIALLCTSGTAAANFFPAIVEAKLTHIPLLVLTADRPHELRENGAPQTIDQIHLYGSHVKWSVDVALPEATNPALRYIRTLADRATALLTTQPVGPVHLNFPLREPLTPAPIADSPLLPSAQRDSIAWLGRPDNIPYTTVSDADKHIPDDATITHLLELMSKAKRGLIVVGPQENPALAKPLVALAQRLGYPILADPLSQMRSGSHEQSHIVTSYDAFLRIDAFIEQMQPELILRFGAMATAKPLLTYLKRYPSCPLLVIDGNQDWQEPTQLASELIHTDPIALCDELIKAFVGTRFIASEGVIYHARYNSKNEHNIADKSATDAINLVPTNNLLPENWLSTWQQVDAYTKQALQASIQDFSEPFEGRVFTELHQLLPEGALLFAGNSMPVRDLDTFFWNTERFIRIMGNRGANGIDGIVSSALGASAVNDGPNVLVLGDLSFFHDMNGLLAAKLHKLNLTIVVINNDGGGIFSFLPQADYPESFEQLFGTPLSLDYSHAAQMYGGHYQRVATWEQFRTALQHNMYGGGLHIIEVPTERDSNVHMHRELWKSVQNALKPIID